MKLKSGDKVKVKDVLGKDIVFINLRTKEKGVIRLDEISPLIKKGRTLQWEWYSGGKGVFKFKNKGVLIQIID